MRGNDSKLIKKNYLKKINLINKYNKAYYKNSNPIVDDFKYDKQTFGDYIIDDRSNVYRVKTIQKKYEHNISHRVRNGDAVVGTPIVQRQVYGLPESVKGRVIWTTLYYTTSLWSYASKGSIQIAQN